MIKVPLQVFQFGLFCHFGILFSRASVYLWSYQYQYIRYKKLILVLFQQVSFGHRNCSQCFTSWCFKLRKYLINGKTCLCNYYLIRIIDICISVAPPWPFDRPDVCLRWFIYQIQKTDISGKIRAFLWRYWKQLKSPEKTVKNF